MERPMGHDSFSLIAAPQTTHIADNLKGSHCCELVKTGRERSGWLSGTRAENEKKIVKVTCYDVTLKTRKKLRLQDCRMFLVEA